jgi:predicted MFS family arabinose efflux permease
MAMAWPQIRKVAPEPGATPERGRLQWAALLATGTAGLLVGLSASGWPVAVRLAVAAGGIVLAGAAFRRLAPAGTLRAAPGLPAAIAVMGLINLGFLGVESFLTLGLIDVRGMSASGAGLVLTAAALSWTAGSWVQAHFASTRSRRRVIQIGAIVIAIGTVLEIVALRDDVSVVVAIVGWAVAGLGMGLAYSGSSLTVLQTADPGAEGSATSAMNLAGSLGIGLGAGIGGALVAALSVGSDASRTALMAQYAIMSLVLLVAVLAAARVPHTPTRAAR